MKRKLEYTICRTSVGTPLVILESPLGNGQEVRPDALRHMAKAMMAIADEADQADMGRGYHPHKGIIDLNPTETYQPPLDADGKVDLTAVTKEVVSLLPLELQERQNIVWPRQKK